MPLLWISVGHRERLSGLRWGPKRLHKHEDLTFWFQGPIHGRYKQSCFVGPLCFCGLLGPDVRGLQPKQGLFAGIQTSWKLGVTQLGVT